MARFYLLLDKILFLVGTGVKMHIEGAFFDWSALKMTNCQTLGKSDT